MLDSYQNTLIFGKTMSSEGRKIIAWQRSWGPPLLIKRIYTGADAWVYEYEIESVQQSSEVRSNSGQETQVLITRIMRGYVLYDYDWLFGLTSSESSLSHRIGHIWLLVTFFCCRNRKICFGKRVMISLNPLKFIRWRHGHPNRVLKQQLYGKLD